MSVVIPTKGRPTLLARAISSVLAQSFEDFEVIVIVDGPDAETLATLGSISDPRLRHAVNEVSVGGAEARNVGVRAAQGEWIAFLDDDDEWLPHKLECQLQHASQCTTAYPIGYSQVIARTPRGDFILPRRPCQPNEHIAEYMLARNSLFAGEGLIQTTAMIVPRTLLEQVPFTAGVRSYQETDWLLRVMKRDDARLFYCAEPLAIWYIEDRRQTISGDRDWQYSLDWIRCRRHLVTPRAYAAFLLVQVTSLAARSGNRQVARMLWWEAWREGRPAAIDILLFAGVWLLPVEFRRSLRALAIAERRSLPSTAPWKVYSVCRAIGGFIRTVGRVVP